MDQEITITRFEASGAARAYPARYPLLMLAVTIGALLVSVALLPLITYGFWVLAEVVQQARGARLPAGPLLPLALATIASWGIVFLVHDRVGALGNERAQALLRQKAGEPTPEDRFVELRLPEGGTDLGWLCFSSGELRFFGDLALVRIPRGALTGKVRRLPGLGGLLTGYVDLPLVRGGKIRLLDRTDISRLSETGRTALELNRRLQGWLDSPPPK